MLAALSLSPTHLIDTFGLLGIFLIIYAECGMLVGFFLPGDSLLFTAGFLASHPPSVATSLHLPLAPLLVLVWVAAIAGDQTGYLIGRRAGPALFRRPDSRLFKQANVDKAEEFFDRHGTKTIVLARFVPVVRTFTPLVAGVGKMRYRTYLTYDIIGGTIWSLGVTLLGYYLGQVDLIANHLELAILAVVALSASPLVFEIVRARRERGREAGVERLG